MLVRKSFIYGFGLAMIMTVVLVAYNSTDRFQSADISNFKRTSGGLLVGASKQWRLAYEDNEGTSTGSGDSSSSNNSSSSTDGATSSDGSSSTDGSSASDGSSSNDGSSSSDDSSSGHYGKPAKNVAMGIRG